MRRFIASLTGKVVSHLVVLALLVPFVSVAMLGRATAQIQLQPAWAVIEFKNLKSSGTSFGKKAAEAVRSAYSKTNDYDMVSQEQIDRAVKTLSLSLPPEGTVNMLRIAQEVHAQTVVTGEISDYRIDNVGSGKQARVGLRVVAYDVASGLPVNGSYVAGESTIRSGVADESVLVDDAIAQAAGAAVHEMQSRTLPKATVLNTLSKTALINSGARSGFKDGQQVLVFRGKEQVATAHIVDAEPDQANIAFDRVSKGVRPGDTIRAVFPIPEIPAGAKFTAAGVLKGNRSHNPHGNPSGLITTLLVVGLVVALLSNGNANSTDIGGQVKAQAVNDSNYWPGPAIQISWTTNGFFKGNGVVGNGPAAFQVYRNDIPNVPILVAAGGDRSILDNDQVKPAYGYLDTGGVVGGIICNYSSVTNATTAATNAGVVKGRPYTYSVEMVYGVSSQDIPGQGSSSGTTSGGTSGTTSSSSGTTSSSSGTTSSSSGTTSSSSGTTSSSSGTTSSSSGTTSSSSGSADTCYFLTSKTNSVGTATTFAQPTLSAPLEGATIQSATPFTVGTVIGSYNIQVEYVLQVSADITFTKNNTRTKTYSAVIPSNTQSTISLGVIDPSTFPSAVRSLGKGYWRVGVRNPSDKPGPLADSYTGLRYIFSLPRSFSLFVSPPSAP